MKVLVAAPFIAGSLKAHAINTVKMAQGFARQHHEVALVCCGDPTQVTAMELNDIYGLTHEVRWLQLPLRRSLTMRWLFPWLAWKKATKIQPDLVYARDYLLPCITSRKGIRTIGETHAHVGSRRLRFLMMLRCTRQEQFRTLVTISHTLADYYQQCGVDMSKLLVLEDAVDLELFQRPLTLPPSPYQSHAPNVVYAGHLYDYKGIPTILGAAALLPDYHFHLVGGLPEDVSRQQARIRQGELNNVTLHGLKPQKQVPAFLWHADLLLLPPSLEHPSAAWTSPIKLGEYLASGAPTIATEIPALRDWLTSDEVEFVAPDQPGALAEGIARVWENKQRYEQLVSKGVARSRRMSYIHRTVQIMHHAGIGR